MPSTPAPLDHDSTTVRDTLPYFLGFVCLGVAGASFGPALPHLADATGSTLAQISSIFVAHRGGFVLGALVAGRLYDRVPGNRVFGGALLIMAAVLALLPYAPTLSVVLVVMALAGATAGAVDVGGNVLLVWRAGKRLGSFMNFLHFSFGAGTFLSPLLLAQSVLWTDSIAVGYLAIPVVSVPVVVLVLLRQSPTIAGRGSDGPTQRPNRLLVAMAVFFLVCYVGAEVGFGNWVYTYALEAEILDDVQAGYVTSAYWGAFTVGRLLAVPLALRLKPAVLIGSGVALAILSVGALWVLPTTVALLWGCAVAAGLSLAPLFPSIVTFVSRRTPVTGGVTGLFLVGASVGAMGLPWLVGQLIATRGPQVMPAFVTLDALLLGIVFLGVLAVARGATLSSVSPSSETSPAGE